MGFSLSTKRILVTGGCGFLGKFVVENLRRRGCDRVSVPRSREFDLRDSRTVVGLFRETQPEVVIHLAGVVGGIGANALEPGRFFYDNAMMGLNVMEQARRFRVEKMLSAGTVCSYPNQTPVPFRETDLWNGYPEEINAPYAIAKKMALVGAQAYQQQYGMNVVSVILANLYGPGENSDLETSHVIPSLIRKCLEAVREGRQSILLWGDGSPTRDFLYAADAAEGIALALERTERADAINLGTGGETSIRDVARLIADECGFEGEFLWDHSRPNGQERRCLDITRAREWLGFRPTTELRDGLRETVRWYVEASRRAMRDTALSGWERDLHVAPDLEICVAP